MLRTGRTHTLIKQSILFYLSLFLSLLFISEFYFMTLTDKIAISYMVLGDLTAVIQQAPHWLLVIVALPVSLLFVMQAPRLARFPYRKHVLAIALLALMAAIPVTYGYAAYQAHRITHHAAPEKRINVYPCNQRTPFVATLIAKEKHGPQTTSLLIWQAAEQKLGLVNTDCYRWAPLTKTT
ncbi:MAG: hypothetical protein Tsb005_18930 [Gammaproteobacteria bacterium]